MYYVCGMERLVIGIDKWIGSHRYSVSALPRPLKDLYGNYYDYCVSERLPVLGKVYFSKRLEELGYVKVRTAAGFSFYIG
jgi:hypothetical protein